MSDADITTEVLVYANEFINIQKIIGSGLQLDFSERSLKEDVDVLIPLVEFSKTGKRPPKNERELSSRFLAYIISALCKVHSARCIGGFDLDAGADPHYYLLTINFDNFRCNISDGLGRAIDRQWSFNEYYGRLVNKL